LRGALFTASFDQFQKQWKASFKEKFFCADLLEKKHGMSLSWVRLQNTRGGDAPQA